VPSARAAYEKLKWMCEHGRENEKVHVVMVEEEQKQRIANDKRQTRMVLNCDDPDQYSRLEAHKDRIIRRIGGNKSMFLSLLEMAMGEYLSDAALDKLQAQEEMEHERE
jgi:hypothetical protein